MKLFRNILIATSALALAAVSCQQVEEGKGDATIGFENPTYVYKESAGRVKLQVKFEDDDIDAVYFVNPLDVADYLADSAVTMQNAFGMTYIENFLGLGTLIMNSSVPAGTVYATAKENIVLYYIPVNSADLGEVFRFASDESGLIGIHEEPDYTNMTASSTVINGMALFAEHLDDVIVSTFGA